MNKYFVIALIIILSGSHYSMYKKGNSDAKKDCTTEKLKQENSQQKQIIYVKENREKMVAKTINVTDANERRNILQFIMQERTNIEE